MKSPTMEGVESDREGDSCEASGPSSPTPPGPMTPDPMAPAQRRDYWVDLLERQRASGLTISAFCRSEGVSLARFFYWKRRLAPDAPAPTRSGASPVPAALLFSELRLGPSSSPVGRAGGAEIVTPSGWVVRADGGADAAWVARLARALEGDGGRAC